MNDVGSGNSISGVILHGRSPGKGDLRPNMALVIGGDVPARTGLAAGKGCVTRPLGNSLLKLVCRHRTVAGDSCE